MSIMNGRGAIEPPPKTRSVHLEDIGAQLEVRRHPGARRLTLRVSRTRRAVIVTLPLQCDLDEAGTFLNRHIDWVRARLDSLPNQVPFEEGAAMPLRGEPHMIAFTGCTRTRLITVDRPKGKRPHILVPGAKEFAANRIVRWLFDEARRDLEVSVTRHARLLSLKAKNIVVRDQTSRWGSCSTTGALSFSWRLVLAPPFVLDYVAAHEVAHLAEMNHGPRFWALVKKIRPDFETAKQWLQMLGPDLHRYGPSRSRAH
ncbi:MAG TPA: SprT family zinc-dependent metalloprotease [Hyphomicrobium sp.]|uniref:M48 family metallopeptidase n=1 Tax=Hyphomicrobium sp. TaxID=82 RepID=UPI002BDCFACF|nr:SprT family zinc-dependent metalloprotease [Hyphomicrobium sp.]HXE00900.1 SprT family zinc-dependent metalloprotease [Hyphomicrobium sp.]